MGQAVHTKRINRLSRIVIPKEILEIFQLKEGDSIDIMHNKRQIIIEPHKQRNVYAVTGKITSEAIRIGEAWISKEGMTEIAKYMAKSELNLYLQTEKTALAVLSV